MSNSKKLNDLLEKLAIEDPDILSAANEVDQTLLDDFARLDLMEKVSWAEKTWHTLHGFEHVED